VIKTLFYKQFYNWLLAFIKIIFKTLEYIA